MIFRTMAEGHSVILSSLLNIQWKIKVGLGLWNGIEVILFELKKIVIYSKCKGYQPFTNDVSKPCSSFISGLLRTGGTGSTYVLASDVTSTYEQVCQIKLWSLVRESAERGRCHKIHWMPIISFRINRHWH